MSEHVAAFGIKAGKREFPNCSDRYTKGRHPVRYVEPFDVTFGVDPRPADGSTRTNNTHFFIKQQGARGRIEHFRDFTYLFEPELSSSIGLHSFYHPINPFRTLQ